MDEFIFSFGVQFTESDFMTAKFVYNVFKSQVLYSED